MLYISRFDIFLPKAFVRYVCVPDFARIDFGKKLRNDESFFIKPREEKRAIVMNSAWAW